jgi:RNA polymerase sigma-70 factor (ECF subfamily)
MADTAGFDEFYLATRGALLRQLTAMTADTELAKDVVQEAYARAWQRWSRVSGLDDPQGWVRTVAWRLAVSQFRRHSVARRFAGVLRGRGAEEPARLEETWDVQDALRTVSPERRQAMVLHDLCGYSVEQVAADTGVPVGTVKSRLSRGRADLARALGTAYRNDEATAKDGAW